jgi:hypothetical protein
MKIWFAKLVAGFLDRKREVFQRIIRAFEIWREATFVAHGGRESAIFQGAFRFGYSSYDSKIAEVATIPGSRPRFREKNPVLRVFPSIRPKADSAARGNFATWENAPHFSLR